MKILIADDDEMVLESLDIILSTDPTLEIIGKATNGNETIEFCKNNTVDVVLMDIQMPVMDGIGACRVIKKINPDIKIIMLTTFNDYKNINQSLHAAASTLPIIFSPLGGETASS
jgi:NarL family two-component system response regulator LiaR